MNIDFKFTGKHFAHKTHEQMGDVLMDQKAPAPEIFYYMCRGGKDQKNITVWEVGTVGGEYIKTYGHYHIGDVEESYWILFGEGIALLQKPKLDQNGNVIPDEVEEFKVIKLKVGDIVLMPKGWGHCLINVGSTAFVTADDTDVIFDETIPPKLTGHADYESIKKMQGFAYYIIDNNGIPALKKNENYKAVEKFDSNGLSVVNNKA